MDKFDLQCQSGAVVGGYLISLLLCMGSENTFSCRLSEDVEKYMFYLICRLTGMLLFPHAQTARRCLTLYSNWIIVNVSHVQIARNATVHSLKPLIIHPMCEANKLNSSHQLVEEYTSTYFVWLTTDLLFYKAGKECYKTDNGGWLYLRR